MRNVREYLRPRTIDEALCLIARKDVRSAFLAGGILTPDETPDEVKSLVDLGDLPLAYVRHESGGLRLGGTTRLQDLIDSPEAAAFAGSTLLDATRFTASRLMRNQTSLAGALLSHRWSCELAVLLLALEAEAIVQRKESTTTLPLADLYEDLDAGIAGAILAEVFLPSPPPAAQIRQQRVARTRSDRAILAAAALTSAHAGRIKSVRVAAGGIGFRPIRLRELEGELEGRSADVAGISTVVACSVGRLALPNDHIAGEDYRRSALEALIVRAVLGV